MKQSEREGHPRDFQEQYSHTLLTISGKRFAQTPAVQAVPHIHDGSYGYDPSSRVRLIDRLPVRYPQFPRTPAGADALHNAYAARLRAAPR